LDEQKAQTVLVTCCDARVPAAALGIERPNFVFTVRNMGNQVCNAMGSIRFGIEVLNVPYFIVLGHTSCGAMRAASSPYSGLPIQIQRELLPLVEFVRYAESLPNINTLDHLSFEDRTDVYSEIGVDYQVRKLLDDDFIGARVTAREMNIVGLMLDVTNAYGRGVGTLNVVNVNGESALEKFKDADVLKEIEDREFVDLATARLFKYPTSKCP
jgi:carbonic anhydrase